MKLMKKASPGRDARLPPPPAGAGAPGTWQGHSLSTRYVLEPLLLRCAGEVNPRISLSERLLLNACEFWAATAQRTLDHHLGRAPHWRLAMASEAFEGCGSVVIARLVKRQASVLPVRPSGAAVERVAKQLEADLLPMAADIDALLARCANRIMNDEKSGVPQPHAQPMLESRRARSLRNHTGEQSC